MMGMMYGRTAAGEIKKLQVDDQGRLVVSGGAGGGGGSSDTTEATQLAVKSAVQSLDAKTPAAGAAQPISAAVLPLPTGAATAARQDAAVASDGAILSLASLAQSIVRNADGSVSYVQVVSGGSTYRQTLTYASGAIVGISAWVKQ